MGGSIFEEKLAPLAKSMMGPAARIQPVSQVVLEADAGDDTFRKVRAEVLQWAQKRAGSPFPKHAWDGRSFDLSTVGAQNVSAVAIEDPDYWTIKVDDADKVVARRHWTTEISMAPMENGRVLFGCRLYCVSRGENPHFDHSIPGLVRQLAEIGRVYVDGALSQPKPRVIKNETGVQHLVNHLRAPLRRSDIYVISLPEGSEETRDAVIDPFNLARSVFGAAHVYVITGNASFALSDTIGREFSVYRGAVRTYLPGFDENKDSPFRHPTAMMHTVRDWATCQAGNESFDRFVTRNALLKGTRDGQMQAVLPPYSEVRRIAFRLQREHTRSQLTAESSDMLNMALEENEKLETLLGEERETYMSLVALAEQERDEAQGALGEAQAQIARLQARIAQLESEAGSTGQQHSPIPCDFTELEQWAAKHLGGSVVVHNRAIKTAKKSALEDVSIAYKALLLMRDHYVPMRRGDGRAHRDAWEAGLVELGLSDHQCFAGDKWGEVKHQYTVNYGGRSILLDRHLKGSNSRDPRYCFRLYFHWDPETAQVVVGSLPGHLTNGAT